MAVPGQCSLRKLEKAALATYDLRLTTYDLLWMLCGLHAAMLPRRSDFHQRKFAAGEVFNCCIISPIQGKASRLIHSEGRLRKQSMRRRHCVSHSPSKNQQDGKSGLSKAR